MSFGIFVVITQSCTSSPLYPESWFVTSFTPLCGPSGVFSASTNISFSPIVTFLLFVTVFSPCSNTNLFPDFTDLTLNVIGPSIPSYPSGTCVSVIVTVYVFPSASIVNPVIGSVNLPFAPVVYTFDVFANSFPLSSFIDTLNL